MVMANYPQLKFEPNFDLDIDICTEFLSVQGGGIDFGAHIVELYPELSKAKKLSGKLRRKEVEKFTKKYYQLHKSDLEEKAILFKKNWEKVKNSFFSGVRRVFGSYPWPDGRYICFTSIYDCNPRFLEDKTFQVYYRHPQGSNHIIAHEMLHFIFFDYLDSRETKFKNEKSDDSIWLLSELFNDMILELPEFQEFRSKDGGSYPEVAKYAKKFRHMTKERMDIKSFFQQAKMVI